MTPHDAAAPHQRLITRNFVVLSAGELAGRLIGFAAMVWAARALGPEAYGVVGFALAIILYFQAAVDGGLELYGPRLVAAGRSDRGELLTTIVAGRSVIAVLAAGLLALVAFPVFPAPEDRVLALYGATLLGVALGTRWFHVGLERGLPVAVSRIVYGVLTLGLVLVWVRAPEHVTRVPLAYALADLGAAALLAVWLWALGVRPGRFRLSLAKRAWGGAAPLLATVALGLLIYNADFILLRVFRGRAEVGLYLAAYALISFLGQLGNAARVSLIPALARVRARPEVASEINASALARVSLVGLPVAVGGFLVGGDLVRDLFGVAYAGAAAPLRILIWTIAWLLWRSVFESFLIARDAQGLVMRATAAGAALNLALNFVLIPAYGLAGAAVATLLTEAVRLALVIRYAGASGYGPPAWGRLARPAVATALMGGTVWLVPLADAWARVGLGIGVYAAAALALGIVRRGPDGWTLRV